MPTDQLELISIDPEICHGQACIRGTRVPVSIVLDCLAGGLAETEIRALYPTLPDGAIVAALAYGALLAREEVLPLDPSSG